MRNVRFLEEARDEFLAQILYYERQQRGLGESFRLDVQAAAALAATLPHIGAPWKLKTRRVFPKGFPYSIVYRVASTEVIVFAVAHFHRRPTYWRNRKNDR